MKKKFITIFKKLFPKEFNKLRQYRYEKFILSPEFMSHVKKLTPSSLAIDVGANVGLVSQTLAMRGVAVIAFEPNSLAFEKLKSVAERYSSIKIRNEAAGIENKNLKLYHHKELKNTNDDLTQASSLLGNKPNVSSDNFEWVNEIDFAEFLRSLCRPVDLIKIDIEGYEVQLINFLLDQDVVDKVGSFYVETHERKFPELAKETEKLKDRIINLGLRDKFFFNWH
jgi:FkbM family methyltransferase